MAPHVAHQVSPVSKSLFALRAGELSLVRKTRSAASASRGER